MPQNLEIKIKLNSHDEIISKLKNLNAEFITTLNQKDVYYNLENSLLKLRIQNHNTELISYNRAENGSTRWSNYEVLEIKGENAENFLEKIFKVEAVVEKKRDLWMFKDTRIHLDEVKGLGTFLELETLVLNGQEDAEKRFNFLVKELNLDFENQIRTSYRNLISENIL